MDASCPPWCSFPAAATALRQAQHRAGTAGDLQLESRRVRTSSQRVGHGPRVFPDPAPGRRTPAVDASALELRIIAASRSWAEGLDEALQHRFPAGDAARLSMQWAQAFPASYKADYEVEDAVEDIIKFESLGGAGRPEPR